MDGRSDTMAKKKRTKPTKKEIEKALFDGYDMPDANPKAIRSLLKKYPDALPALETAGTLAIAAASGQKELVEELLGMGVDPNQRTPDRLFVPLIGAATAESLDSEQRVALIKVLLDAGADVNTIDVSGLTVLDHCEPGSPEEAVLRGHQGAHPTPIQEPDPESYSPKGNLGFNRASAALVAGYRLDLPSDTPATLLTLMALDRAVCALDVRGKGMTLMVPGEHKPSGEPYPASSVLVGLVAQKSHASDEGPAVFDAHSIAERIEAKLPVLDETDLELLKADSGLAITKVHEPAVYLMSWGEGGTASIRVGRLMDAADRQDALYEYAGHRTQPDFDWEGELVAEPQESIRGSDGKTILETQGPTLQVFDFSEAGLKRAEAEVARINSPLYVLHASFEAAFDPAEYEDGDADD
jgi:hypothetical protein